MFGCVSGSGTKPQARRALAGAREIPPSPPFSKGGTKALRTFGKALQAFSGAGGPKGLAPPFEKGGRGGISEPWRGFQSLLLIAGLFIAPTVLGDPVPLGGLPFGEQMVDRIVAAVDDDPIFLSDIERVIRLGLTGPRDDESDRDLCRRVLDDLIEQRLRLHEVERFGAGNVPAEKVDRQMAILRQGLDEGGDEVAYHAALAELGLDEERLRHLVTRQLRVLIYIEERVRARVFVDVEDIRIYHETELKDEMERVGAEYPPMKEVETLIRALLTERRLDEEIEAWTQGLRLAADIIDHFEGHRQPLPPVVLRLEADE